MMKIRHYLRYPLGIIRAKRLLSHRDNAGDNVSDNAREHSGRPVALDLYTTDLLLDCGRHFSALAHYAAANASPMVLRCTRITLAAIAHKPFGAQMLEMPNVSWVGPREPLPADAMVLTDLSPKPNSAGGSKLANVEMNLSKLDSIGRPSTACSPITLLIGKDTPGDCPVMPYPMHPGVLKFAVRDQLEASRGIKNRRGIFFSGSQRAS